MHTHLFNLRYLPLKGILYRSRVPWPLAGAISNALLSATGDMTDVNLVAATEQEQFDILQSGSVQDIEVLLSRRLAASSEYPRLKRQENRLNRFLAKELKKESENIGILNEGETLNSFFNDYVNELASEDVVSSAGFTADMSLMERAESMPLSLKVAATLPLKSERETVSGYLGMLYILMMREDELARYMMEQEYCGVDYFVHHMMDLEIAYRNKPEIRFSAQLDRVKMLQDMFAGKLLFFGAYDPFRRDAGLAMVDQSGDAGAVGIKFYPPSGYRAGGTEIPDRPSLFTKKFPFVNLPFTAYYNIRRQHKSRYGAWQAADIDQTIDEFIQYVNGNLVIFSHHSPGGFEAYAGYGGIFGDPGYWGNVLRKYPDLKLVIGHAGGGEGWFGTWEGSYAQRAYNLCVLYENVYCDFGYSDEVFNATKRQKFADLLLGLIQSPEATTSQAQEWRDADLSVRTGTAPWVYPITSKMLYGSDWMMVSRLKNRRSFVRDFNKVFDLNNLGEHREAFFGGNAIRLLELDKD